MPRIPLTTFVVLVHTSHVISAPPAAPDPPVPPKLESSVRGVRTSVDLTKGWKITVGVVEQIGEGSITLRRTDGDAEEKVEVYPTDLLAKGKVLRKGVDNYFYRWADVKKGDGVGLVTLFDEGEERLYCLQVCIGRRPGEKLPQGQDPLRDRGYKGRSLLNDIDNGEDVSDDDIAAAFPPTYVPIDFARPEAGKRLVRAGGLNADSQKKLDAIRAKAAVPKPVPPEK